MTAAGIAAARARWPDHPWFAPGGLYADVDVEVPRSPGPDPAYWAPTADAPPPPSYPRPEVVAAIARARRIGACRVRQLDGCGCGGRALCFRSGSGRRVTIADCRACPVAAG